MIWMLDTAFGDTAFSTAASLSTALLLMLSQGKSLILLRGAPLCRYSRQKMAQFDGRGLGILKQMTGSQYLNTHQFFASREIKRDIIRDTNGTALELPFQQLYI